MTEKQILVNDLKVNYKTFGEGKPFLILHGWGSKSDRWEKVAELLVKNNIQIIIPDLPGFGQSQEPKTAWNLDNYEKWLWEFTRKVPQLNRQFYLAGHSFGGALAAKFAIKYNQEIIKLFLISSACVRKNTTVKKLFYRLAKITKLVSFLPNYELFRKAAYKFVLRKSDYPHVSGIMKEIYLKVILDDLSYKINFLKVPTVLIWGDKDESTPLNQAHFIHNQIPNSVLCVIPGADHLPHIKIPEILAQKIIENLKV